MEREIINIISGNLEVTISEKTNLEFLLSGTKNNLQKQLDCAMDDLISCNSSEDIRWKSDLIKTLKRELIITNSIITKMKLL